MPFDRRSNMRAQVQDKIASGDLRPQFWKPIKLIFRIAPSATAQRWLKTPTSLTAKLKSICPTLAVVVLSEKFEVPMTSETQRLGLEFNEEAWVRCVLLRCGESSWVYARTIIPNLNPTNPWQVLKHLGNKPLGEVLFDMPSIERSDFEFAKEALLNWPHLTQHLNSPTLNQKPGFARRSVFKQQGAPLLLTEVFLPDLLEQNHD